MKTFNRIVLISVASGLAACSSHTPPPPVFGETGVAVAPQSIKGNTIDNAGPAKAVSGGPNQLGVLVPTGNAVAARIENGLEGNARATTGNFSRALTQVRSNMPKVTDVNNASGFDQIQLLVYAACSDLTTGTTPLMQSRYNVQASASVSTNRAALVAAGVRMLDQHVAKLASEGPDSARITEIFTALVDKQAAVATNTSRMAFMAVCIAANTAGTTMLGL